MSPPITPPRRPMGSPASEPASAPHTTNGADPNNAPPEPNAAVNGAGQDANEGPGSEPLDDDAELRADVVPPELLGYEVTEDGVAQAFADQHGNELRYCKDSKRWHLWDGSRWKPERTDQAFDWVRQLARRLGKSADAEYRRTIGRASFAGGVERFARADRKFAVTADVFDRDPWLLGTPSGTIDLRTGVLHPPSRDDYITKSTSVAPAMHDAPHPTWDRFLDDCTLGDPELRRYLQQVGGYCLTGDVSEECMFFLYGAGGNGKGTFLQVLGNILADYATSADMATFTEQGFDRHPTEVAKLCGARMVTATETEMGRAWAWSRIKELTGRERPISARFMRQDFFEFDATFKLVFAGNHKPSLPATDEATARRMNLLPFDHKPARADPALKEKLRPEYPAILRWMIDGCLDWRANRLVRPACVIASTQAYLQEQDLFGQWLADECESGHYASDTRAKLMSSWGAYAAANGERPGNGQTFHDRMVRAGFEPTRHTPGFHSSRGYLGVQLRRPSP